VFAVGVQRDRDDRHAVRVVALTLHRYARDNVQRGCSLSEPIVDRSPLLRTVARRLLCSRHLFRHRRKPRIPSADWC
jgi:hypothetical protein